MEKLKYVLFAFFIVVLYLLVPKKEPETLEKSIQHALKGSTGTYAVIVKSLKEETHDEYILNGDRVFETGSLYKLWVMAEAFNQIQNGTLKENEVLSEDIAVLNKKFDIASESAEIKDGTITVTVAQGLKQMITISHNYAALLLSDRVGLENVALFLEKNGFKESRISKSVPVSTPKDIALFLEKLYKGELANQKYTQKMLYLLKMQKLNDKLPKYLPIGTVVAHKTGEINFLTHDAGIVYTKNGDYIIVVFSKSNYPSEAKERIAQISRLVYKYFMK